MARPETRDGPFGIALGGPERRQRQDQLGLLEGLGLVHRLEVRERAVQRGFRVGNNRAVALRDNGDLDGARSAFEQAVDVLAVALPDPSPMVADTHANVARILVEMRQMEEAALSLERAIAIYERCSGPGCARSLEALRRHLDTVERMSEDEPDP